jgi:hypothetical protein
MARKMTTAEGRAMAAKRWSRARAAEGESEAESRRRLARARADKTELEVRARRAELVERAKVERVVFDFARRMRDAWVMWPARVAAGLAAKLGADPHAVETALAGAVRQHLEELSRDPVPAFAGGAPEK